MSHAQQPDDFVSDPVLRRLIFSQQPQGPAERHCRGFMPRGNESEKIRSQFLIVQGTTGFWIACRNEEVQDIIVIRTAAAPRGDDLIGLARK